MRRATLIFALALPTLVTWVYFVALEGGSPAIQQGAYAVGKTIQFAWPLLWLIGNRPRWSRVSSRGFWAAIAFGAAIAGLMLAAYLLVFANSDAFREPIAAVRAKTADLGLDSPAKFIALSVFYALGHAFLEEYYWRWFVFGRLCRDEHQPLSLGPAIAISSLGFAAHHVLLLARFFGWLNPLTYVLSLSVAIGGGVWAWFYDRDRSLLSVWLSHALIDAAIFAIGFAMLFR